MRGANLTAQEVPEWKQKAMGKAPTLGVKDSRPIKDQRESLPIFLLRDQLIQAVHANQVLVVIGETGMRSPNTKMSFMCAQDKPGVGRRCPVAYDIRRDNCWLKLICQILVNFSSKQSLHLI